MSTSNSTELELPDEKAYHADSAFSKNDGGTVDVAVENYYMSGPKLGVLIAGLCLALFLLGLDTAIVSTVSNSSVGPTGCIGTYFSIGNPKDYREV
jgi:hypothetical protein